MNSDRSIFARRLLRWYDRNRRDLPWRAQRGQACDPYHVLISEAMLQQTQVATVIPYFLRFIKEFPSLAALAQAPLQEVLRLWQGLGYYSRARHLLEAAQQIISEHGGAIPREAQLLGRLPGIGPYTAGAIASIAFDRRAPILDGNVARVLCRLDLVRSDPRNSKTRALLWDRAEQILPRRRCGDFNSALMELGATVCTPRSPDCAACPVQAHCKAFAAGEQDRIPIPRKPRAVPLITRRALCLGYSEKGTTRWLIEQRPFRGRWAGLWQFITTESNGSPFTAATVLAIAGVKSSHPIPLARFQHALSHRRYEFEVYLSRLRGRAMEAATRGSRRWVRLDELGRYPLPAPHVRIAAMLRAQDNGR